MKALYPKTIVTLSEKIPGPDGKPRAIGYWKMSKDEKTCQSGGDTMATCLCALQLMVYYRYLPTTSLKATEVEADIEALSKDKGGEVKVTIDI